MEGLQLRHIYLSSIPTWSKSSTVLKCLEVVEHCILIRGLCCHKDGALGCETWPCLFTVCFSAPPNSHRSLLHPHRSLYRKGKQRLEPLKLLLQQQFFKQHHHQQKKKAPKALHAFWICKRMAIKGINNSSSNLPAESLKNITCSQITWLIGYELFTSQ